MWKFLFLSFILITFVSSANESKKTRILILGDSLTEGYGVEVSQAYPARLQKLIHDSGKMNVSVIAAGVSGATSASGPSRIKWFLKEPPQIMILELGGNDLLRGIKPEETKKNLLNTIKAAKRAKIKIILAGMRVPPNYGKTYVKDFERIYPEISKSEGITLIPFLLDGVGGVPELNQEDGIHPNEKGHQKIAQLVFKYLEPFL